MKDRVKIGLIQTSCCEDKKANIEKTIYFAEQAVKANANIICTQELFATQYFCQSEDHKYFELAEPIDGETTKVFQKFSSQNNVVSIISIFERRARGVFHNTAVIIDSDGSILGFYRKMHIPDDPLYYEKFYFTPGDTGFISWNTKFGKLGVLICWDQWYPEAARLTAMKGADIIFYPTAIGWHPSEKEELGNDQFTAWQMIQRAHAIANGCYVAACNRIGHERPAGGDGIEFWGQSFICDPFGRIIALGSQDKEEVIVGEIDFKLIEETRTHWPFFRDRRIDFYNDLTKRWSD